MRWLEPSERDDACCLRKTESGGRAKILEEGILRDSRGSAGSPARIDEESRNHNAEDLDHEESEKDEE